MGPTLKSKLKETKNTFRNAFRSYGQIIGILASGASLFNLLNNYLILDLSSFIGYLLEIYRAFFHKIIDAFLFFLPFKLPGPVKDGLTTYLLFGAVVVRSYTFLIIHKPTSVPRPIPLKRCLEICCHDVMRTAKRLAIWPTLVRSLFSRPYVYYEDEPVDDFYLSKERHPDIPYTIWFEYDIRIIFMLQVIAMIFTTVSFVALNSI